MGSDEGPERCCLLGLLRASLRSPRLSPDPSAVVIPESADRGSSLAAFAKFSDTLRKVYFKKAIQECLSFSEMDFAPATTQNCIGIFK